MKKLDERSSWEEEWAKAFEDARQTPSPNVWNNIHAVQADKEADKYRKRIGYYKWLAAASVFLSICSAAIMLLNSDQVSTNDQGVSEKSSTQISPDVNLVAKDSAVENRQSTSSALAFQSGNEKKETEKTESISSGIREKATIPEKGNAAIVKNTPKEGTDDTSASEMLALEDQSGEKNSVVDKTSGSGATNNGGGNFVVGAENEQEDEGMSSGLLAMDDQKEEKDLQHASDKAVLSGVENTDKESSLGEYAAIGLEKKGLIALEIKEEKVEATIRKLWVASNLLKSKKASTTPRFMLGATFASNNFRANYLDNSPEMANLAQVERDFKPSKASPLTNARVTDWDEEQKSMMSITGGVQGAAWLGKRWVLQGGIQYGNYKTASTASTYTDPSGNHTYPLHFSNYSDEKVEAASFSGSRTGSSTVAATNSFEFVSVPLSIGYVVVDRKLSLLLTPGISSEFFLSNELSSAEEGSGLDSYTVGNGEDSPFSLVHFRGLIGAQLFYKMSDHYLISLEPGYQQAITDFNKSDSFFNSRPSNISIAAGFRYIFH